MKGFYINGVEYKVTEDPTMPLLWFIREILNLKGTKFGCGKGLCGSCTIHLNGAPVRSCQIQIGNAAGQKFTTIEGLNQGKEGLHNVQKAWIEHDVPQCGYCQVGQIMSAAALLEKKNSPTDQDIDQHMSGNICRCGTYPRIKQAIKSIASGKK